jgi:pantoate kinase
MSNGATAFVPGHVTGFFTSEPDPDPSVAGSRGGGITLADGVTVTVEPSDSTAIFLNAEPIEMAAVEGVLDSLGVTATVRGETDLPLGAGFGVSGAMALGAALGANTCLDRSLSMNQLVTIAHKAEVEAGTGLGDVVAQAHGGVVLRLDPGGPAHNTLDAIPAWRAIEYYVIDELSTEAVLDGETAALTAAGSQALSQVRETPTLSTFMQASRQFARDAELLTDQVREVVTAVREAGGEASMAMLGETVFALDSGLSDAGYDATSTTIHDGGATLTDS